MEHLWRFLVEHCSDFMLYAIAPTIVVNLAWFGGALVGLWLDGIPSLRRYKIQERANGTPEFWRCVRRSLLHKLVAEVPLTFAAYPIFVFIGVRKDLPLPGAATVALTLAVCLVIEDAWHYFAHRTLHTRWAYRHIHYLHHHYTTPFAVAASYAHPLETVFTGFGTVLPVLLLRPHLATVLLWVVVKQLQATLVHSGYQFPWRPSRFLPFLVSAGFHDWHHRRFNRNYAPNFVWLDRLLGTADEG
jgi:methylsterol monooxygenase